MPVPAVAAVYNNLAAPTSARRLSANFQHLRSQVAASSIVAESQKTQEPSLLSVLPLAPSLRRAAGTVATPATVVCSSRCGHAGEGASCGFVCRYLMLLLVPPVGASERINKESQLVAMAALAS